MTTRALGRLTPRLGADGWSLFDLTHPSSSPKLKVSETFNLAVHNQCTDGDNVVQMVGDSPAYVWDSAREVALPTGTGSRSILGLVCTRTF